MLPIGIQCEINQTPAPPIDEKTGYGSLIQKFYEKWAPADRNNHSLVSHVPSAQRLQSWHPELGIWKFSRVGGIHSYNSGNQMALRRILAYPVAGSLG